MYVENKVFTDPTGTYLEIHSRKHGVVRFLVDEDVTEDIKRYTWSVISTTTTQGPHFVAVTSVRIRTGKHKTMSLHRFLLDHPRRAEVGFRNWDPYDLRLVNLQIRSRVGKRWSQVGLGFDDHRPRSVGGVGEIKQTNFYFLETVGRCRETVKWLNSLIWGLRTKSILPF